MTRNAAQSQARPAQHLQECNGAATNARELAVRTGRHRPSTAQAAVVLHGSRANGTHRPDSDTDMVLLPVDVTGDPWTELGRTLERFQRGHRAPFWVDQTGTDIVVAESWNTLTYNLIRLDTAPVQCWSTCQQPVREHYDDSENRPGQVMVQQASFNFPSRRLHEQNAVIYADSDEILDACLNWLPAVPTGPRPADPLDGMPMHILESQMFGVSQDGGYGRGDFWDREPENTEKPPRNPRKREPGRGMPRTTAELAETAPATRASPRSTHQAIPEPDRTGLR